MTTTHAEHQTSAPVIACVAACALSCSSAFADLTPVVLAPATFEESVGIGSFSNAGTDLFAAESVSLTVLPGQFADRGGGTGSAWIDPVDPVSTRVDLSLIGGPSPSGVGGTVSTRTRYEYTVIKLDPLAPDVVDLSFSGFASVTVENNQPQGAPTWFSYAVIWVDSRQFGVRNYDANGIYAGLFEETWDHVALGSMVVGTKGTIELDAWSHGEGAGPDFLFASRVLIDPTIEVSSPQQAGRYRVEFSSAIGVDAVPGVPEPATCLLTTLGLAALAARQRLNQTRSSSI